MIARVWRGWTSPGNADRYEGVFRTTVLPHLNELTGYVGAHLLRGDDGDEVAFVAITYFESLEAIRAFAGADPDVAVVSPQARPLLSRFDERVTHYTVLLGPDDARTR